MFGVPMFEKVGCALPNSPELAWRSLTAFKVSGCYWKCCGSKCPSEPVLGNPIEMKGIIGKLPLHRSNFGGCILEPMDVLYAGHKLVLHVAFAMLAPIANDEVSQRWTIKLCRCFYNRSWRCFSRYQNKDLLLYHRIL